jgi:hypothetical protein
MSERWNGDFADWKPHYVQNVLMVCEHWLSAYYDRRGTGTYIQVEEIAAKARESITGRIRHQSSASAEHPGESPTNNEKGPSK